MSKKARITTSLLLASILLILAACSRGETTPTPNAEAVYTQAASTFQAGLTQTAALLPTSTATQTPAPTNTVTPTSQVTATSAVSPTSTIAPTSKAPVVADKAAWISQNPGDGTVMTPGQDFTMVWTVKNMGSTTWNTSYQLRFFLNDPALRFHGTDIKFPKEVKPGESVDLSMFMEAPQTGGDYTTIWVMTNDQGANFYTLTLSLKVSGTQPVAPSATPTTGTTP